MLGQDSIPSVLGPMSNSLSGVKAFMKAVIDLKPWTKDPLAVRKSWDENSYLLKEHGDGKDLCFAIIWNNGIIDPTPPIRRGLQHAIDRLSGKNDIQIVPISLPDVKSHYQDLISYMALSGSDVSPPNPDRRVITNSKSTITNSSGEQGSQSSRHSRRLAFYPCQEQLSRASLN